MPLGPNLYGFASIFAFRLVEEIFDMEKSKNRQWTPSSGTVWTDKFKLKAKLGERVRLFDSHASPLNVCAMIKIIKTDLIYI